MMTRDTFATIAAGLATAVSTWLALLITTGILLLLALMFGLLAVNRFQKGTPPVPEQAIRQRHSRAMAGSNARTVEQVRQDIEAEREQLAGAAENLRESIDDATNVSAKIRSNLPIVAAGALGLGFLFAGGVGATARLIFRRGRVGETKAKLGRFRLVDRD